MPPHPGTTVPRPARRGWWWLLPLTLTVTFIAAAHLTGLILSGALHAFVGGLLTPAAVTRFLRPATH